MPLQTVFITKYALTKGIIKAELEVNPHNDKKGIKAWGKINESYYPTGFWGNDFWLSEDDAKVDCENRRIKKIKSLHNQISQLNKNNF